MKGWINNRYLVLMGFIVVGIDDSNCQGLLMLIA